MTTATEAAPVISENGRREFHKVLDCVEEAEGALEQVWFGEGLKDVEHVDRETTWLLDGFTSDAILYVGSLVRSLLLIREKINNGDLTDDESKLLEVFGRV